MNKTIKDGLGFHWSNLMPLLTILAIAGIAYQQFQITEMKEAELQQEVERAHKEQAEANREREVMFDAMGALQLYNEERFEKILAIEKEEWVEGESEDTW